MTDGARASEDCGAVLDTYKYPGSTSAITAGLHDVIDAVEELKQRVAELVAAQSKPPYERYDLTGTALIDLRWDFDHILNHCTDAIEELDLVYRHIEAQAPSK